MALAGKRKGLSFFAATHHQGLDSPSGECQAAGKKLRGKDRPRANHFEAWFVTDVFEYF